MEFKGVYTALITPFIENGTKIDYNAFNRLIERQVEAGIAGVVPCGTTGESPTLNHIEHRELIKKTVDIVKGRMKVIAGTGSNSTAEAVELTRHACEDGADAVMLVNPYYNKPSQRGLFEHFKKIAETSTIPVVLYNIRGRTGVNVEISTFKELLSIKNIHAVKEASGDPAQMAGIQRYCSDR
ncbi:MAG: 4-hydroxy-tetrahydrodipicolinate synthase, partial [Spirochaetia bacterium]|nr:4-hydroxy-tetrahydrodipicolinate synthase [Spirochaetia bacterium]